MPLAGDCSCSSLAQFCFLVRVCTNSGSDSTHFEDLNAALHKMDAFTFFGESFKVKN